MEIVGSCEEGRGSLLKVSLFDLPFSCKEVFTISGVPAGVTRGRHAHKQNQQLLVLLRGEVEVKALSPSGIQFVILDKPGDSFFLPALTWGEETFIKENSILQVFASHLYDYDDYIFDLSELKGLWKSIK